MLSEIVPLGVNWFTMGLSECWMVSKIVSKNIPSVISFFSDIKKKESSNQTKLLNYKNVFGPNEKLR